MAAGTKGKYDDIINLPHPISKKYKRMDVMNRAAQFAPFAALTGYGDAIHETGRLTDRRIELDENAKQILDEKMSRIVENPDMFTDVEFTYFVPDERKSGGRYETIVGQLKRIDIYQRKIELKSGETISIDNLIDLCTKEGPASGRMH